ncbi:Uncharacterised protein [Mycobacteroides abscessus subsp. abscessus]|nr:Uncharacterised protein [Mycobacteroides abscessus subsp. abscessus]
MPPTPPTAPNSHCQRRYWRYHRATTDPAAHHLEPAPAYRGLAAVVGQTSLARPACGAAWRPHPTTTPTDHYHQTDRRDPAGRDPSYRPSTGTSVTAVSGSVCSAAAVVWSDHRCVGGPGCSAAVDLAADASGRRCVESRTVAAADRAAAPDSPAAVEVPAAVHPDSAARFAIPHQIRGWLAHLAIPD